jgi:hypothetical protein
VLAAFNTGMHSLERRCCGGGGGQIDRLVYEMYNLSDEEIKVGEGENR